jgi:hypothetical protein
MRVCILHPDAKRPILIYYVLHASGSVADSLAITMLSLLIEYEAYSVVLEQKRMLRSTQSLIGRINQYYIREETDARNRSSQSLDDKETNHPDNAQVSMLLTHDGPATTEKTINERGADDGSELNASIGFDISNHVPLLSAKKQQQKHSGNGKRKKENTNKNEESSSPGSGAVSVAGDGPVALIMSKTNSADNLNKFADKTTKFPPIVAVKPK